MWGELLLARETLAPRCRLVKMKSSYVQFCEIPGVQEELGCQFLQDVVAQVSVNLLSSKYSGIFFTAIWSETIRFRLDLLRYCNINNLDVSVCSS